jgi:hypothetical protein
MQLRVLHVRFVPALERRDLAANAWRFLRGNFDSVQKLSHKDRER